MAAMAARMSDAAAVSAADMAILQRALAQLQSGAAGAAEATLRGLSSPGRGHADAIYLRAIAAEGQGRQSEARELYEAALRAAPYNAGIWNSLATLLDAMGDSEAAITAYGQAVAASPTCLEAWINMGLVAIDLRRWDFGANAMQRALALAPDDGRALGGLGLLEQGRGRPEAAVAAFDAALAIDPTDARTRHNLATSLRALGRHDAALAELEQAMRDGLTAPETAIMRAHLLSDLGRFNDAVDQYRGVVAVIPDQIDAQAALALLLPQIGRRAEALDGFRQTLRRHSARAEVWTAAIGAAHAVGDAAQMLDWAGAAMVAHGPRGDWELARIGALTLLGDPQAAITAALAADPAAAGVQNYLAYLYLQTGDVARAETHAITATRLAPLEQSPWALLTLIWRLTGDPREQWLLDYDRLVMVSDLIVPPGWRDLAAFLGDLAVVLGRLHVTMAEPAEQSLRGGTQTRGALFDTFDPVLAALKSSLIATVEQCISTLPRDAAHPFLVRSTGRIDVAGSWSVRLRSQGFHVSHMHPSGWLSSAFYVGVPPEVAGGNGGALQFGVPETALGLDLSPRRVVTPAPGRLVLFPSYVWHGTAAFESSSPRLTVAFDSVPGR
jgi:tetratricopeptide (TPR) repeat protein